MKAIKVYSIGDAPEVVNLFEYREWKDIGSSIARYRTREDGEVVNHHDYTGPMFFPYSHKLFIKLSALHNMGSKLYKKTLRRYVRGHGKIRGAKNI